MMLRRPSWTAFRVDVKSLASTEDVEKGSDSSTDSDVVEWPSTEEAAAVDGEKLASPEDEVNDGAVALLDFHRSHEKELPLNKGELVWIHRKSGQGWLVAQNLRTTEIGLVPENFVQLREGRNWYILEV